MDTVLSLKLEQFVKMSKRWRVTVPQLKRIPVVFAMKHLRKVAAAAAEAGAAAAAAAVGGAAVGGEEAVL